MLLKIFQQIGWGKHFKVLIKLSTFILLINYAVVYGQNVVDANIQTQIKQQIKNVLGQQDITQINPSPVHGLYEVVINNQIIYSTKDANYIFLGNILNTKTKQNITQINLEQLQKFKWQDFNFGNALIFRIGDTNSKNFINRQIVLISDPNCGFCKKMEKELLKVNNVTIYNFITPLLSNDSFTKSLNIWCQKNPQQTWNNWMLRNIEPPKAMSNCKNPLQANINQAQKLGINGTPALLFKDGSRISGFISAKELNTILDKIK